jgi:hypothetical protein
MSYKTFCSVVMCLLLAPMALVAANMASGTVVCAKAEKDSKIEVPDQPGHVYSISQSKCSWTKPMEIGDTKHNAGVATGFDEITGTSAKGHGTYVDTLANGDTAVYTYQTTGTLKDGALQTADDTWTLVSVTGKLKGAKGHGKCKGTGAADGSVTWNCQGTYQIPK